MSLRAANISGIATIAIWSLTSAMLALTGAMPPFQVGAFSFLLAFFVVLGWWIYRGDNIAQKFVMPLRSWALGLYGIFLYNAIYIFAFKTGPALEVNLLNYMWPAFLIIFGCMLQKKYPDAYAIAGIVLCFCGSYFVFRSRGDISFSGDYGILCLAVLCGIMWGSYSALSKYVKTNVEQIAVFFLVAGVAQLILHLMFEPTTWPASAFSWCMLITYAFSRGAFFSWDYAMKHGHSRLIGSISNFIPLFSTIGLTVAGVVTYNPNLLIGAALIISGCIVINLKSLHSVYIARRAVPV